MPNLIKKLFRLFLPIILGSIVGLLIPFKNNYQSLNNPPLSPPSILFPIVWTILYLLMGISYYKFKENNENDAETSIIYYIQLFFNILWSVIFFGFQLRFLAIIWIIILDMLIIALIIKINKKDKIASYLLIPYLLWTLFATYLTIGVYILN